LTNGGGDFSNGFVTARSDTAGPRLRRQSDFEIGETLRQRVHAQARRVGWATLGALARPPAQKEWIQFQFYHWVLDDQRPLFRRQLAALHQYGDFLSLDDAVSALQSPSGIGGRYFCVTFDDGFKHCFTNAAPLLTEFEVPAAFFVPTQYIGLDLDHDWQEIAPFYAQAWTHYQGVFEFLDWDECRELAAAGFTIGSHTHSHRRLTSLQPGEAERELSHSKDVIEARLGRPCRHFCCPWGKRDRDFDPAVHPEMARRAGYASFLTAEGGLSLRGDSVYNIRRAGCEPDLSPAMLRYALFPPFRPWLASPAQNL
jgi:peptidoglycan/xylan/chitin deacetylase (PgdA/CDA1 family)